jgi:hypothetical protein
LFFQNFPAAARFQCALWRLRNPSWSNWQMARFCCERRYDFKLPTNSPSFEIPATSKSKTKKSYAEFLCKRKFLEIQNKENPKMASRKYPFGRFVRSKITVEALDSKRTNEQDLRLCGFHHGAGVAPNVLHDSTFDFGS